jgi:hypothetical protein
MNIQITLPPGARLIQETPSASAQYELKEMILDYRLEINTDQWIEVIYQP